MWKTPEESWLVFKSVNTWYCKDLKVLWASDEPRKPTLELLGDTSKLITNIIHWIWI
ncbi:MAG: hypothetical protein ACD_4C00355G0004 [uncultured bacterium (gcode 4)]|uniref:Uncharacterized protein n=1 Tax=uncultured bacterium (gcode 4) TaxID=1234023 RepID=K2FWJ2_9BACT|nr:MAG: hypothetical protein ACD_4C00355G0004 [uncultured bacterium (gcode 4)]